MLNFMRFDISENPISEKGRIERGPNIYYIDLKEIECFTILSKCYANNLMNFKGRHYTNIQFI